MRIVVRGDFQNKVMIVDTWDTSASMRTMKYFLADSAKHKAIVHPLYFNEEFLQVNFRHIVL